MKLKEKLRNSFKEYVPLINRNHISTIMLFIIIKIYFWSTIMGLYIYNQIDTSLIIRLAPIVGKIMFIEAILILLDIILPFVHNLIVWIKKRKIYI
jgi:hypothetical protein